MLPLLPIFSLAQIIPVSPPTLTPPPPPEPKVIVQPQEVRVLPGQLDNVPMFNSNSPEVVQTEGILLSTFPGLGTAFPYAHLNLALVGRFDLFAHHIARASTPEEWRPMYLGVLVYNPGNQPVQLDILQAVSYVTNPDAPFIDLPTSVDNPFGQVYSGPGSRLTTDILRGVHQPIFPSQILIPPRQSQMLFNLPITLGNCRSTFMRLRTNSPVYMASLAMYAPLNSEIKDEEKPDRPSPSFLPYRAPTLEEWQQLLVNGNLAQPRDRIPTPPHQTNGEIVYSRVAGVALGSQWRTQIVDNPNQQSLSIPQRGKAFSYPLSTVPAVTLATGQVQSAPMLVRYPDTAYRAHGNYGVHYHLTLPLVNNTGDSQTVTLAIQTPLKQEDRTDQLRFLEPPNGQVFFRGTVQIRYNDDRGLVRTRLVHVVQRRGQQGEPLVTLNMPPRDRRLVEVDFLYPPDATPPQVLTVRSEMRSPSNKNP
ncbi:MAG TPA: hypothetical protein DCY91_27455 [Cyanobacteria bacterium UBA11370]|nr:hypothetical protein [Cyanobacteria bacterium UBA11370]HBY77055.1 hypothetical protein [Cyanobacteria bacterium UBA11148]